MDVNKRNLEKPYWDKLDEKYPGYIEYFIQHAKEFLKKNNIEIDFYELPYQFQIACFFDYVGYQTCEFEVGDVCDYDQVIELMEDYFCDEHSSAIRDKQALKNGEI